MHVLKKYSFLLKFSGAIISIYYISQTVILSSSAEWNVIEWQIIFFVVMNLENVLYYISCKFIQLFWCVVLYCDFSFHVL